jgi:hypothetical protein
MSTKLPALTVYPADLSQYLPLHDGPLKIALIISAEIKPSLWINAMNPVKYQKPRVSSIQKDISPMKFVPLFNKRLQLHMISSRYDERIHAVAFGRDPGLMTLLQ